MKKREAAITPFHMLDIYIAKCKQENVRMGFHLVVFTLYGLIRLTGHGLYIQVTFCSFRTNK